MKPLTVLALAVLLVVLPAYRAGALITYLDNGVLRLGVDDLKGGAIVYLRHLEDGRDIVNDYDLGREIQQSYYSGPADFDPQNNQHPSWNPWPWNPVAAGDAFGHASRLEELTSDGNTLYIRSVPKQWALNDVDSECTLEQWITLDGHAVNLRCRLNNARSDTAFYAARHQELPAAYTNTSFRYLHAYIGDEPFTGDVVSAIPNPEGNAPPWAHFRITENWAALVDGNGWGLGVYHPGVFRANGGFHDNAFGAVDCGHISPVRSEHIDHDIVYEYASHLVVGDLQTIRDWVYDHPPQPSPHYDFGAGREGWTHVTTTDRGFPWPGFWRVELGVNDPFVVGPWDFWDAEDVPTLHVRARYEMGGPATAEIFFGSVFEAGRSVTFPVIDDGQFHTYAVDMTANPLYTGKIERIRFDPAPQGEAGDHVDIAFITGRLPESNASFSSPEMPLALQGAYPNPFNPSTALVFEVAREMVVDLRVFDVAGRPVARLLDGWTARPGTHEVVWDGRDAAGKAVASGMYFYRLESGPFHATRRMTLVR